MTAYVAEERCARSVPSLAPRVDRDALPPVVVRNFSALGEPLPAVGLAYTPFQVCRVARVRPRR